MEIENPCIKCIGSCCALKVDVNRGEYNKLVKMNLENNLTKNITNFIIEHPEFKGKEDVLDEMYEDRYAVINLGKDGYCAFLNRKTRLCEIYEDRPDVCRKFSNESKECKKIRKCIV
jgi:hypothetical protein